MNREDIKLRLEERYFIDIELTSDSKLDFTKGSLANGGVLPVEIEEIDPCDIEIPGLEECPDEDELIP